MSDPEVEVSSYVALNEFQDYARNELVGADDLIQQTCLDAAEQMINDFCGRSFTVASVTAAARQYTPVGPWTDILRIHDCVAITSVVEDGATLAATDYQAEPLNNFAWSGATIPYEQLRRPNSIWYWDGGKATVTVTARWGWTATPDAVKSATLIIAKDVYQQRNTTSGVAGFGEFGAIRVRMNPLALNMLTPYRRAEAFGIA